MRITLLIIAIVITTSSLQAEKIRIAIMDFRTRGVGQSIGENIAELIRVEMIKNKKFTVVERKQMDLIFKEQELQQTGCTETECAVEAGKILSVNKILIGMVMEIGREIVITARVVDVESGISEFSEKQNAIDEKNLYDAVSIFVAKLNDQIEYHRNNDAQDFHKISFQERVKSWFSMVLSLDHEVYEYDAWYAGISAYIYFVEIDEYDEAPMGFATAVSISNPYHNYLHTGCRIGALTIDGVSPADAKEDQQDNDNSNFIDGKAYIGNGLGIFADIIIGLNIRLGSGWFGIKPYGGIGLFAGYFEGLTYHSYEVQPATGAEYGYFDKQVEYNYITPVYSAGFEFPMGKGKHYIAPVIEIRVIPTPDEIDQGVLVSWSILALKYIW